VQMSATIDDLGSKRTFGKDVKCTMQQERETVITARKVSFAYATGTEAESRPVVSEVDLAIETGTFVSIIGHNGSGKSTLAKLFNALLVPAAGTIVVSGFETGNEETIWEIRRQVGMVFQNPDNQIVGTTVEDDVAFGMENVGVDPMQMRARVDASLQAVKMDGFELEQPHRLSGGQKQRVAIAGILAMRPAVIILDEATAMLDPQGRKEVVSLVHQLHVEHGLTVINITHFPEETLISDRVIVMHEGNLVADGSPEQVYAQVDKLRKMGLDVPFAVRLRHKLASNGIDLSPVLLQEDLVEELCKLLLRT